MCLSSNGELVRGDTYLQIAGKTFSEMPGFFWIGLTDLLHERKNERSGWIWSDGTMITSPSELSWYDENQPGLDGKKDCIVQCHGSGRLCEASCNGTNVAGMCQPLKQNDSVTASQFFEAVPFPVIPSAEGFAEYSCSSVVQKVESEIECAVLCRSRWAERCASFYFKKSKKKCRLILYTDVTLRLGDSDSWVKFKVLK